MLIQSHLPNASAVLPAASATRRIVHRTRGHWHGPVTRLMSPSDLGEVLKPFVFLDIFDTENAGNGGFGLHPHSGIATLTCMLQGSVNYEDTTGATGVLPEGGIEWMQAGGGVWHGGSFREDAGRVRGFQLWLALPPSLESGPAHSVYLAPDSVPRTGPASVLLGHHGTARSAIDAPAPINYLAVRLKAGERWRYEPPTGHTVAWAALSSGGLIAPEKLRAGELAIFEESNDEQSNSTINFHAELDTEFVLGSAAKHPHELVLGRYSVHTSNDALREGEARIRQIGARLHGEGRLR